MAMVEVNRADLYNCMVLGDLVPRSHPPENQACYMSQCDIPSTSSESRSPTRDHAKLSDEFKCIRLGTGGPPTRSKMYPSEAEPSPTLLKSDIVSTFRFCPGIFVPHAGRARVPYRNPS